MSTRSRRGGWLIFLTFLFALILTAIPLPAWAVSWRPAWVVMVLVYWCIILPDRVGIGIGWFLGLLLDTLTGTLLGQHALALAVVAYIALKTHRRVRLYPLAQQTMVVGLLVFVQLVLMLFVKVMTGFPPQDWSYVAPVLTSMLFWPWLYIILGDISRKVRPA